MSIAKQIEELKQRHGEHLPVGGIPVRKSEKEIAQFQPGVVFRKPNGNLYVTVGKAGPLTFQGFGGQQVKNMRQPVNSTTGQQSTMPSSSMQLNSSQSLDPMMLSEAGVSITGYMLPNGSMQNNQGYRELSDQEMKLFSNMVMQQMPYSNLGARTQTPELDF